MTSETILVVDDNAASLNLIRSILISEGYKVVAAGSSREALELLGSLTPDLVAIDLKSAQLEGIELARRLKQDGRLRDALVVATADPGDEQQMVASGCDAYVARPVNAESLALRIRALIDERELAGGVGNSSPDLQELRMRFLAEGRTRSRELLSMLDGAFQQKDCARIIHQWIGTGGLLGYTTISRLARETEAILAEQPLDSAQLREALTNLALTFSSPPEAREAPLPESIVQALNGKRITGIEFPVPEQQRLDAALSRVGAHGKFLSAMQTADSVEARSADLLVIHVNAESAASPWLDAAGPLAEAKPVVLAGNRAALLELPQAIQSQAREFLMDGWQPDEALVRLSLALASRPPQESAKPGPAVQGRTKVVIADDDPAVLALVRTALENFGMECNSVSDGPSALEAIRQTRPRAAVLDVNMPGMDGYEVLAAVRREQLPVQVLLLTARQQESDVIRGFTLGADDYVVKPFSPMELVARLKRLFMR